MSSIDNAMAGQLSTARLNVNGALPNTHGLDPKKIKETAQEFESVFIAEMLRPMFDGIETSEMFGGGNSEKSTAICRSTNTAKRFPKPAESASPTPLCAK